MASAHRPCPAEDFAGYLHAYHADAIDGDDPVDVVWDRYHVPEGTHRINGRIWEREKILDSLRTRRSLKAPYELHIHEVTVEGRRAAARYTVGMPMLGKMQSASQVALVASLAEDGRVAGTHTCSVTRPGWSGRYGDGDASYAHGARPVPGTSPAGPPADGAEPTPAQDPAHYLRAYYAAGYDPSVPLAEAYDRFHTLDAVHQVGRKTLRRSGVLKALRGGRRLGHVCPVEVHETLREGNRFAARFTTSRDGDPGRPQGCLVFGEFAPDGRVRVVRFAPEPAGAPV